MIFHLTRRPNYRKLPAYEDWFCLDDTTPMVCARQGERFGFTGDWVDVDFRQEAFEGSTRVDLLDTERTPAWTPSCACINGEWVRIADTLLLFQRDYFDRVAHTFYFKIVKVMHG